MTAKVKQLVWGEFMLCDRNPDRYAAETVYGTSLRQYKIVTVDPEEWWSDGGTWYKLFMADDSGPYRTLELAQSAAQRHYEAWVNTALVEEDEPECPLPDGVRLVREIDLSKGENKRHPDIIPGKFYLVKIFGDWYGGQFNEVWHGLNFTPWGMSGAQYDKPGTNASGWERVIEVDLGE